VIGGRSGAAVGDRYHYLVQVDDADQIRLDPPGPRATAADGDSIVYDPNAFQWEHVDYTTPPASGLVVYEMHVGSFFKMDVSRGTSTTRPPSCRTCATSPSTRSSGG
jgi:1,4-alpha-glucan branching enzyme